MRSKLIILFWGLIFIDVASPLEKKNDTLFQTDIFEAFTALTEYPKNVTRNYTFELMRVDLAPDGVVRPVWAVNGQYPGPMIRANIGDKFNITVKNHFGDPTAIHWHGIDQKGTNWFDGVPGTTQCPIPNGVNFSYIFNLNQSGTYWYHSHFFAQLVDGTRGPIVIHDPNDPNKNEYDYEFVMTVSDWYHIPTGDPRMLPLLRSANYTGIDPVPDSAEISGVGQYNCTIPNGCTPSKFATYKVKKGKRYRFRIINMSAESHFWVSIDKHPLTIIETDGIPIHPVTINTLQINIAQRYSVIVHANQSVDNYWIRAHVSNCSVPSNNDTFNFDSPLYQNEEVTGILRYEGALTMLPTYNGSSINASNCYDVDASLLKPYSLDRHVPQKVDTSLTFEVNVTVRNTYVEAIINNSTYYPNLIHPTNERIIGNDTYAASDNVYFYHNLNSPIEIIVNNTENRTHPFHLHGHFFWVVAQGDKGSYNQSLSSLKYDLDNPPYRDTFTLREFSLNVIRYYADNPGVWLFHCHIEWHLELGMAVQLIEVPEVFKNYTIPNSVHELCDRYMSWKL